MWSGSKRVINRDYSMESAHEQFLFTSCNASKKRTSECSNKSIKIIQALSMVASKKRTSECSNKSIKIIQALSMVWCFHFIHFVIFSHFNSKIEGEWLWKYIVRPIRDTNDSTSLQCYNLSMYKINNLITHFEEKLYNYL